MPLSARPELLLKGGKDVVLCLRLPEVAVHHLDRKAAAKQQHPGESTGLQDNPAVHRCVDCEHRLKALLKGERSTLTTHANKRDRLLAQSHALELPPVSVHGVATRWHQLLYEVPQEGGLGLGCHGVRLEGAADGRGVSRSARSEPAQILSTRERIGASNLLWGSSKVRVAGCGAVPGQLLSKARGAGCVVPEGVDLRSSWGVDLSEYVAHLDYERGVLTVLRVCSRPPLPLFSTNVG